MKESKFIPAENLRICVDFDGTIVEHEFPEIGEPLPHAFRVLRRLQDAGHELILFTCREDYKHRAHLQEAINFCEQNGVTFHAHNENSPTSESQCRKPYVDIYIDDRNFGGFPGWVAVEFAIFGNIDAEVDTYE